MVKRILILIFLIIIIGCENNDHISLGEGYKIVNSASFNDLTIVTEQNVVIVYGNILDYAFDSIFIITLQCPRDSVSECTGRIQGITKKKSDEAFAKSTIKQYWIINKKEKCEFDETIKSYSNVYGPYKKEEYVQKREELNVPKDLKLKE